MIIYNVTINIEESISKEWMSWMQKIHIPEVMNTGIFVSAKMTRVMVKEQMGGITYSIQYSCKSQSKLDEYQVKFAPKLQQKHTQKFEGKFVAFRTLLEVISDF